LHTLLSILSRERNKLIPDMHHERTVITHKPYNQRMATEICVADVGTGARLRQFESGQISA
jgi:hypothetical protein